MPKVLVNFDNPVRLIHLVRSPEWKHKLNSMQGFYVLKLPDCVKMIKLGRSLDYGGGLLARLTNYHTKYGDMEVLHISTWGPSKDHVPNEKRHVSLFEQRVIKRMGPAFRGNEYYHDTPGVRARIKKIVEELIKTPDRETSPPLRRSARL